ncbi:MAG TPA: class III signal peptide-containing protein [Tepidisphaeraceae bacterium]|jgi:hypothetical protein|nr:class III signal peptide-containing protein [Tepidisphaeraceae bacterium]
MVCKFAKKLALNNKGQGLVEYGILVAGVALIGLVSTSVLGHKASSMLGTVAAILPGTEATDSGPVTSGSLIETSADANGHLSLDSTNAADTTKTDRLDVNTGIETAGADNTTSDLVFDPS